MCLCVCVRVCVCACVYAYLCILPHTHTHTHTHTHVYQDVAHILNDETTRKYIQSFKRLMTYAQNKFPPDSFTKALEPTAIDKHGMNDHMKCIGTR